MKMAPSSNLATKRAWKLQEFVAHGAQVNCLALGHKSGRVLVTGGDDKKVNLWAVGKPNCIMSLSGHTTPVDCVRFGQTEELVCAGSRSGALKIWDLEAARLVRSLTGHKSGLTTIDFHPYGDFLSSGSSDTNLKLWDIRRKGCIFTYKGHSQCVNSVKFSPDGQWIASGGEDGAVKIWDLRAGKLMTEFNEHAGAVQDVEFHPHEFLLASASSDRTVNFWDLESFQLVSTSERDSGPVRCITFHPESECLFSGSHESFKVHLWEPHRVSDSISMGWGKIKDIAVASKQLIAASHQMSNVSIYVVDLKRVQPMGSNLRSNPPMTNGSRNNSTPGSLATTAYKLSNGVIQQPSHVRRSFVKEKPGLTGTRPDSQIKTSEEPNSDKSGTDPEDSDAISPADINDYRSYENIFRPRQRELSRTPPMPDEPFQAPSGSESDVPQSHTGSLLRPNKLKLRNQKKPSPSPTRRTSQSGMHSSHIYGSSPDVNRITNGNNNSTGNVRIRRTSNSSGNSTRPMSVYESSNLSHSPSAPQFQNGNSPTRHQRSTSVQPRSAHELDFPGDTSPTSEHFSRASSVSRHVTRVEPSQVSRVQINGNGVDRPLERPTVVRPTRSSLQHDMPQQYPPNAHVYTPPSMMEQVRAANRLSQPDLTSLSYTNGRNGNIPFQPPPSGPHGQSPLVEDPLAPPEKDKFDVIPMNADKPCGLEVNEFLPQKFQDLSMSSPMQDQSRFSAYKSYQQGGELSEQEVTSSILKGHESMMAVLTRRGRNIEILHKLWQNKDAKAAVDQAVSLNDQAVVVDLLSVISLRPSIWNLDLCTALLPSIGDLLQSKYEMYINTGCAAMKLILKNFASVIKSNIDSPVGTVGVDISREERHNKCMQCYKDLVKIRSLILKRQTMSGKLGHTYRELSILMQYLD